MSARPGALGLLWLWATATDLGPGGEPEAADPAPRLTIEWTAEMRINRNWRSGLPARAAR
jgi:hypothetical protein